MYSYKMGGVSFSLGEYRDLSFLERYGKPFCAFDRNISGNIGFGMDDGAVRRFVKIAGLPTVNYTGNPADAVKALRKAVPLYEELSHPNLIRLTDAYETDSLFIAVFQWENGECLYDHWNFETYRANPAILSPAAKFRALPASDRMRTLRIMLDFLLAAAAHGYAAIDFYDGSILYDFDTGIPRICDIDFFEKIPHVNTRGLMWGDDKFRAPEEYTKGAVLDEATNVYRAGAMMFYCLGDPVTRSRAAWTGSEALFQIAGKAVSTEKRDRYRSVADLMEEWNRIDEA